MSATNNTNNSSNESYDDEIFKIYGEDGTKNLPGLPRKKIRVDNQKGSGPRPQEPVPSTSSSSPSEAPLFEATTIRVLPQRKSEKFRRTEEISLVTVKHNLKREDIVLDIDSQLSQFYKKLMAPYLENCHSKDILSTTLHFEQLTAPIFDFTKAANFDPTTLQRQLYNIAQSRKGNFLDGVLRVRVAIIRQKSNATMRMDGSGSRAPITADEKSYNKRSVVTIQNQDNLCGFRAIAVGVYHQSKIAVNAHEDISANEALTRLTKRTYPNIAEINKNWNTIRRTHSRVQAEAAVKLRQDAGLDKHETLNLDNIQAVELSLDGIKIIVVNQTTRERMYPANIDEIPDRYVCIEYIPPCDDYPNGHYNCVTNITAYMDYKKFCIKCWVGGKKTNYKHACVGTCCKICHGEHAISTTNSNVRCSECKVEFDSQICFDIHLKNKRCDELHHCETCKVRYKKKTGHVCSEYICKFCRAKYTESPHYCCLSGLDPVKLRKQDAEPKMIIAYDIESHVNTMEHAPVLLVSQTTCCHAEDQTSCELCGEEEEMYWFLGKDGCTDVIRPFIDYVMEKTALAEKVKGKVLAYAHNSRGYDCHFILRKLINLGYQNINLIMSGAKILKLTLGNVGFVDSLSLFQQPLKNLPKAFGLGGNLKKGDFPHKFNITENMHKITDWPGIEYYEPERKSVKEAADIREFVALKQASGEKFDYDKELLEYCRDDVRILLQSLVKFRKTFIGITGLDPITRCFTLPAIAFETYRAKFYNQQHAPIGITPQSYRDPKNHSMIGDAWMDWISDKYPSVRFNREQRIGTKWVDGAILPLKKVFEFNGCNYHGCPKCNTDRDMVIHSDVNKTVDDAYNDWIQKENYLKSLGFDVNVTWECELHAMREKDPVLNNYIKERVEYYASLKSVGEIELRDVLFGGRTSNVKFHCVADGVNSEIKYVDFTSLYPYVVSKRAYPIGHPKVVSRNFDDEFSFRGFSKCKVLPPKHTRFGVLPVRLDDRLVFPLCLTCAQTQNQSSCRHTDEERCITGTWPCWELGMAISRGYKVIKIYQQLEFEDCKCGMFSEYIKLWMKEKQEASGWPSWCQTEGDKQIYIARYKDHEDIDLDPAKIEHNPGRRFIAKLMLNSFWGKFAQRNNMGETVIITKPQEYFEIIEDPTKEITSDDMVNEDTMLVSWKYADDRDASLGKSNVMIAALVTSYARLELFLKIEEIERHRPGRVLYFDTDSVIYEHRNGDPELETGDYLGQLTDEISSFGPGAKCIEFASGGPKNYALKVRLADGTEKVIIKAKGITLNEETSERITFSEMKRLIDAFTDPENPRQEEIVVNQFHILANPKRLSVKSRYYEKIYRVVAKKRRVVGNDSLPFGYVDEEQVE